jgi:hypothetical protein
MVCQHGMPAFFRLKDVVITKDYCCFFFFFLGSRYVTIACARGRALAVRRSPSLLTVK